MFRAPSYMVSLRAKIVGYVPADEFKKAVENARKRHPLLGVRVVLDEDSNGWFIADNVPEIPIRVFSRQDDSHWLRAIEAENRIPFNFDKGPLVRFVLLNCTDLKYQISDMIVCCHHGICDGLSLCYIIRDILSYLTNPNHTIEQNSLPSPLSEKTLPKTSRLNTIFKGFVSPINKKWIKKNIHFDENDYKRLFNGFWKKDISVITWEIEERKVKGLIVRCREENVSVHSALTAAFVIGQYEIQDSSQAYLRECITPINLRNRMNEPVGEEMGFYVSGLTINIGKIAGIPFWELARKINADIKKRMKDNRFIKMFMLNHLNPSLLDALHFAQNGAIDDSLARFVLKILKWHQIVAGLEISNLGKLDFPKRYGPYRLEAIFGPIILLPRAEKFIGIITVADKMTFSCTYRDSIISTETVEKIRNRMLVCLHNNV